MKKVLFLMLMPVLFGWNAMNGQVAIGDPGPPHEGALLDLSKVPNNSRGLLFPRVSLNTTNLINTFQLSNSEGDDGEVEASGMVVYDTNTNGLYLWIRENTTNPGKWNLLE
ncbi:MAG: hypothetical protein LBQ84_09950 [Flavobacteriaceae bacterium]|jgi:hypothetical protein|nr:hypothetical protein [Flavobacteriaceae bacterium]